jgi:hypothetical protein
MTRSSRPAASTTFRNCVSPHTPRVLFDDRALASVSAVARRRSSDSAADRSCAEIAPYCSLRERSSSAIFCRMTSSVSATGLSAVSTFDSSCARFDSAPCMRCTRCSSSAARRSRESTCRRYCASWASSRSSASRRAASSCARRPSAVACAVAASTPARDRASDHATAAPTRMPITRPMTRARICMTRPWQVPPTAGLPASGEPRDRRACARQGGVSPRTPSAGATGAAAGSPTSASRRGVGPG